jgi:hypothetical protein
LGDVGQITLAREWNEQEREAFEKWEKSQTPPPPPPAGYVAVDADTQLIRGMPILAGWMAEWTEGEVIDVRSDGSVLVKYESATESLTTRPRNWLAVSSKILDTGRRNPESFSPSVFVLPNGRTPITADLEPLEEDVALVPGVPLRAEWAGKWSTVTTLKVYDDGRVRIHWDGWGSNWDEDRQRDSLAIAKATLAELNRPGARERFAERAKKSPSTAARPSSRRLQNYPIRSPLPSTAVRVEADTPVEKGIKLACNWASRWEPVTVLEVHDDGTVRIHWDNYGSSWDGDISRDCLIIEKKVLAKLQASSKSPPVRIWTDTTGKFQVEATLVSVADGTVKLRLKDGREVDVPLAKLSKSDQDAVAKWEESRAPAENPFVP